jgi:DNA-binding NtrC family response regulator
VDDESSVREYLSDFLGSAGHSVQCVGTGAQALSALEAQRFDAALLDVVLPDLSGLEVLERYRSQGGTTPVIVLSALSGADDAVRAMRLGATDYLAKPFGNEDLEDVLQRALGSKAEPASPPAPSPVPAAASSATETRFPFVCSSPGMRKVSALVERIADTDVPVLLLGESGTGKEVVAREIHRLSRRTGRTFIKVNCAALPAELLESELFGHERGAFTGATAEKPGKFELADRGTIFLDEIGEMAIRLQAKLLQVLQDEEFFRVGGKKSVKVDARVVVATNRELEREIEQGNFREDLYYRLNVVAVRLPPLRDRREDIVPLVDHFLRKYGERYRHGLSELPAEVLNAFRDYDWPGNVRELENLVRRLVVLNDPMGVLEELRGAGRASHPDPSGQQTVVLESGAAFASNPVRPPNPFAQPQPPPPPFNVPEERLSLKDIGKRAAMLAEREAILDMLQRTAWNKRKAASKLRISYKALLYKIKESGIVDPRANAEF